MLAAREPGDIQFPVYASPKLDGIRAVVIDGQLLSRKLKPITNTYTQASFGRQALNGLDGELIVGEPFGKDVFNRTTGPVRREEGYPQITFWVFDWFGIPSQPYEQRLDYCKAAVKKHTRVSLVPQIKLRDQVDLEEFEEETLAIGYEGVMIRSPHGLYKYGRSTNREGYLCKIKRFDHGFGKVIGFDELMHNLNPQETNELGKSKRSSHKANMVPGDTLGSLIVFDKERNVEVRMSGFTDAQRYEIWSNREKYLGREVRYKFFPIGIKDKPRHPIFLEFL